jgi:hypothetical protein
MDAASLHAGELGAEGVPVEGIAVQRLGMEHELSALRGRHGGGDTDPAAELVRRTGFPLADALDLRRVQRIDLGAALMLILVRTHCARSSSGPKRASSAASPSILRRIVAVVVGAYTL